MTPRLREVLSLIALGHTNAEIGALLGITHETVKAHVRSIHRALLARSRAHAVALALREGEIE